MRLAKACALREIWLAEHDREYGLLPFVAARDLKYPAWDHPSALALHQLFASGALHLRAPTWHASSLEVSRESQWKYYSKGQRSGSNPGSTEKNGVGVFSKSCDVTAFLKSGRPVGPCKQG